MPDGIPIGPKKIQALALASSTIQKKKNGGEKRDAERKKANGGGREVSTPNFGTIE